MSVFLKKNTPPPPKQDLCCARCNGKRIIQSAEIKEYTGAIPREVALEIPTGEKALFGLGGNKVEYAWVYVNLCVDCGFIDWFMKKEDAEMLWEVYQKTKV